MKMIGHFPNISSYGNENGNMVMTDAVLGEAREFFLLICMVDKNLHL